MGQKLMRVLLFSGQPFDTNRVLCCIEKLCVGTDTAPHSAHPLYRLSPARKRKIYESEKRKIIGQTTALLDVFVEHLTTQLPEIDFRRGDALRVAARRYLREWQAHRDGTADRPAPTQIAQPAPQPAQGQQGRPADTDQATITRILHWHREKVYASQMADRLNAQGVPTLTGEGHWTAKVIRQVLRAHTPAPP
jgi:hypothetical protein